MMRSYLIKIFIILFVFLSGGLNTDVTCQEFQKSLKQLTFDPETDYYPSWSPDGKYVAFSSSRAGGHVWKVPSDGGTPVQVTKDNANHPSWSPEGSFIAFDCEGGTNVRIISPNGGIPVRVVPESIKISRGAHPCWSPDGSKVTFSAEGDIWTVDLPTGNLKRIFHKDGYYARAFCWSPDGMFISADVKETGKTDCDVWLLPTDGGESVIITQSPGRQANPYFSPDGSLLIYMSTPDNNKRSLWITTTEGGKSVKITTHEGFNANPRWSPDGKKIVFASDKGGNVDIWVMELDTELIKEKLGLSR